MLKVKSNWLSYPQNQVFSFRILLFAVTICLFSSCDKTVKIDGFDTAAWKKDFDGCNGYRKENAAIILAHQEDLIGKHENTITQLLGHPNRLDLGKKMKRMAYYVIENSSCVKGEEEKALIIDFSSISQARLVMIQKQ